jgi:hypothetical protein
MSGLKPISYRKAFDQIYFETNGSEKTGDYNITLHSPNKEPIPLPSVKGKTNDGLKEARIIICKHILEKMNGTGDTIFNQYCVSPDRSPKSNNQWNQWKVSQFI